MSTPPENESIGDPLRRLRDATLAAAGELADNLTGSERFGRTMGRTMNLGASMIGTVRSVAHGGTELAASWLNLPTRAQLIELSKRINHLELMLDDVEMAASELHARLAEDDRDD